MSFWRIVFTIILPPLGVLLDKGIGGAFILNIILTVLGYFPGLIHVLCVQQVVDCNDFDVRTFLSSTENNATDTAKTVDTYFDSHIFHQLFVSE